MTREKKNGMGLGNEEVEGGQKKKLGWIPQGPPGIEAPFTKLNGGL